MKTCSKCKESKPLAAFSKNAAKRDGLQTYCKECKKAWYDNYYRTEPKERERLYANRDRDRAAVTEYLREAKDVPCTDCGERYPYWVMDFDHLGDKEFTIARALHKSIKAIKQEVAKCEVVCANCHRTRTHERMMVYGVMDSTSSF